MGWKGTVRTFGAIARSMEREARRQQRELERQQKELSKMQELERAQYEVNLYQNHIDVIKSIHKDCGNVWDWQKIGSSDPPNEPTNQHKNEYQAQRALDSYTPTFFDKLLGKTEKKRTILLRNFEQAKEADKAEHQKAIEDFKRRYEEWRELTEVAGKLIKGDVDAYLKAIEEANPFEEIQQVGSAVEYEVVDKDLIVCTLHVRDGKVIPTEVKSVLKSGKLSVKPMPTTKFNELYQDYVCSCVLRVARELFALLPIKMTIVNAVGRLLNTKTGHMEDMSIVSVAIPKETLENLNFDTIDPSDSMENFVHRMNFKKSMGFSCVEVLIPADFQR